MHTHGIAHVHHFVGCEKDETCICNRRRYWIVFAITVTTLILESIGGYITNSLSLLSDCAHVAIDVGSVGIALYIEYWVHGKSEQKEHHVRAWGGMVSSIFLLPAVILIANEAGQRFFQPEAVQSTAMLVFAVIGLAGNMLQARALHGGHKDQTHKTLNAHVVSDLIQSVVVVAAGVAILCTGQMIADAIGSVVIFVLLTRIAIQTIVDSYRHISSS